MPDRSEEAALLRRMVALEVTLALRSLRLDRWSSLSGGALAMIVALVSVAHLIAWSIIWKLPIAAPLESAQMHVSLAASAALFLAVLLAAALSHAVDVLFSRGDLDLLFSSPAAPRAVLVARFFSIAAIALMGSCAILLPLANVAVQTGRSWLTGLYVVIPLAALWVAAAAMLLALVLVRLVGARRARVMVQVFALLVGCAGSLAMQFWNKGVEAVLDWSDSTIDLAVLPGRIALELMMLDPLSLLLLASATALMLWVAWRFFDRDFLRARQQLADLAGRVYVGAQPFVVDLFRGVLRKEWRCMMRDPLIISRLGNSFLYLLTALVLMVGEASGRGGLGIASTVGAIVFLCGTLASQLSYLMFNLDEVPELAYGGTMPLRRLLIAKAVAAALPAIAVGIVLLVVLFIVIDRPLPALIGLIGVALASGGSAAAFAANTRVFPRDPYAKAIRQPGLGVQLILSIPIFIYASGCALLVEAEWALGVLLLVLGMTFTLSQARSLARMKLPARLWRDRS